MSWPDEKQVKYITDWHRILRGEIDPFRKEPMRRFNAKLIPKPDKSKFRHFTRVIPRDEWGAIPAVPDEPLKPLTLPVHKFHYSLHRNWPTCYTREECTQTARMMQLREINERGLTDVRHNFMIGNDCNVYEGRGWSFQAEIPYDCDKRIWDDQCVDIGFFGETEEYSAFPEMISIAEELMSTWKENNLMTKDAVQF